MFFRTRMGFAVGIVCVWCVQGSSCGVGCMSGGPGALYSNGVGQCYSLRAYCWVLARWPPDMSIAKVMVFQNLFLNVFWSPSGVSTNFTKLSS